MPTPPEDASKDKPLRTPKRLMMLALGPSLIVLSPVVGLIPGPGGLLVLLAGVAITLQSSQVAKRLLDRARSKSLAGWGFAEQSLPEF